MAEADASLLQAVHHRMEVARAIGERKSREGLALRDFRTEGEVLERWRQGLAPLDIPPERAESLARWLVEESVRVQERLGEPSRASSAPSDIVVAGGLGQMGGWMREYFRAEGHRVGVYDPRAGEVPPGTYPFPVHNDLRRAIDEADVLVVATPMRVAPHFYREIWKTQSEAVIFDILSVKAPLLPTLRKTRERGFHVTSLHPLFGPGTRTLSDRNLLILDCGDAEANARARALFATTSLTITEMPLEQHDRLMAEVLSLPHAMSLLFGRVLAAAGHRPEELARAAPTSYRRHAEVARIVTQENPELAFDIQALNPATTAMLERLARALRDLQDAVTRPDATTYLRQLGEARQVLEADPSPSPPEPVPGMGRDKGREGTAGRPPGPFALKDGRGNS